MWAVPANGVLFLPNFLKYSIKALEKNFLKLSPRDSAKKINEDIVFEILTREDRESTKYVDVSYLQSLPQNKNAVFQVVKEKEKEKEQEKVKEKGR